MKKHAKQQTLVIAGARATAAAILVAHFTGHTVPLPTLQLAELLTVLITTLMLLLAVLCALLYAAHILTGSRLPKAPNRPAWLNLLLWLLFAAELAAFALAGWWFTLGARVFALVILSAIPQEREAAC